MGFHSLQIGKSALQAANYGINVTGQNLANINTTGYSRQSVLQGNALASGANATYLIGSGVSVNAVVRVNNFYAEKQLRSATSGDSYYSNLQNCYTNLQNFFLELSGVDVTDGVGLSDYMNNFWGSMSDLSANVETIATRSTLLESAKGMTDRINEIHQMLTDYRSGINSQVESSVAEINGMLKSLAELNKTIVTTECGGASGVSANDLRDTRDQLLRQLSELMDVEVTEEGNGSCIVAINGRSLVYYDQVYDLSVKYENSGGIMVAVPCFEKDMHPVNANSGQLAALVEIRDSIVPSYIDELNQLASAFTWEFNRIYSQTRGLEPYSSLTSLNTVKDPSVTLNQLQFLNNTMGGTFQITNGELEVIVYDHSTGLETSVKIEIDLDGRPGPDGEPDMILWDPADPDASHSFINRLQKKLDEQFPGAFKVSIDSTYHVTIESLSDTYGFSFGKDESGILAALGMNVLFTGFTAADIGVNQELFDNPKYLGTSYTFATGDNGGINDFLAFRETGLDRLLGQSTDQFYLGITGRLASEAFFTTAQREVKADLKLRMFNQREEVSGVNEDEEALNLIAFQRAYQSAAKFITVVDEIYETLLAM